ncbi:sulfite exporter TauE/SafE family protein [Candidatus Peregrinibacteria bacterium]|jgi:uncharacterized protein|nr:sulfite exporter TauE/SafE family protein [Candidatus Peregrinibacteria bacterium]MBT4055613.1 sulfite exporter TauE/SafE family protein [Candidatus Peregrinibacteria bacterium]
MQTILIVFVSSLIATFLSVMSGGGASTITLPVFLWTGMSLPLAIAVHKVCAIFWTPISAYNYLKDRKINWGFLLVFAAIGLVGAYLGVQFVLKIDESVVRPAIGVIILTLVAYTYFKKDLGIKEKKVNSKIKKILAYPTAIIMGFYESVFGAGNGIVFTAVTFHSRGFDFINALGYYFAVAFFWASFASVLYIQKGYFDLGIMSAAILGSTIGSYAGSKYAKLKGNKFIKTIFIIIGGLLGVKLILGF